MKYCKLSNSLVMAYFMGPLTLFYRIVSSKKTDHFIVLLFQCFGVDETREVDKQYCIPIEEEWYLTPNRFETRLDTFVFKVTKV